MSNSLKQLLALRKDPRIRRLASNLGRQFKITEKRKKEAFWEKEPLAPALETPVKESGIFTSRDGTSIFYEVVGKGRPLLFCYGLVCRREHWHHQIRHFSKHYQVITFDYRGHHRSSFPQNDQNMTLEWLANDVVDLAAHLNLSEMVCLGHSLGVPVLTLAGNALRDKVKALILVCGSVVNPFEQMFYSRRASVVYEVGATLYDYAPDLMSQIWQRMTYRNRLSFVLTSTFGFNPNLAEEQDVLLYLDGVNHSNLATFHNLLRDYTRFDGREKLKTLSCPTLVMAGDSDCITPIEIQEETASLIPEGKFFKVPKGSHNAHMELPALVNSVIDRFLTDWNYR